MGEEFSFRGCGLTDDKTKVFAEFMPRFAATKKADFAGSSNLSANGWRDLLQRLRPTVEELCFRSCGLNDDIGVDNATVFAEFMPRFAAMKEADVAENEDLSSDWADLLRNVSPNVEVIR